MQKELIRDKQQQINQMNKQVKLDQLLVEMKSQKAALKQAESLEMQALEQHKKTLNFGRYQMQRLNTEMDQDRDVGTAQQELAVLHELKNKRSKND